MSNKKKKAFSIDIGTCVMKKNCIKTNNIYMRAAVIELIMVIINITTIHDVLINNNSKLQKIK